MSRPIAGASGRVRDDDVKFGRWITARRERLGFSGSELARRAGVGQSSLWKIENASRPATFAETLMICRELDTSVTFTECDRTEVSLP